MPAYMSTSLAGDAGAAVAGQTAQEIAPGNATADIVASLIGGGAGAGAASRFTAPLAATPSLGDLKVKAKGDWDKVKAAPETLTDSATAGLDAAVRKALPDSQLAAEAYPKAYGMSDKLSTMKNPTVYDAVEARRIIGDRVAGDPSEASVGSAMKREISSYLDNLKPGDLQGGTADDTVDAFRTANRTTHQIKKAEAIINKEMRGETRAANTGSGGNEVNATRQNIRTIFDKERDPTLSGKRAGYTPDEMAAMEKVVMGTTGSNLARNVGKLSPASGALGLMGGFGGAGALTAGIATGSPMMGLLAAPSVAGMFSKSAAEGMTKRQIAELLATVLNGGKAPGKSAARSASELAIVEQLLSGAASASNPQ